MNNLRYFGNLFGTHLSVKHIGQIRPLRYLLGFLNFYEEIFLIMMGIAVVLDLLKSLLNLLLSSSSTPTLNTQTPINKHLSKQTFILWAFILKYLN